MERRKYESDLSIDDLLNALDASDKPEELSIIDDLVFSFIDNFQIKEGKNKVKVIFIFDLFKKWNKKSDLNKFKFAGELKKYFNIHGNNIDSYYILTNKEVVTLVKHIQQYKERGPQIRFKKTYNHFNRFLEFHNITKGDLYIEADVFYHVYDTWVYNNNIYTQLSYERFVAICNIYFNAKQFDGSELTWFGVSANIKDYISVQAVTNWRQGRAKRGKKSKVSGEDEEKIIYPNTQE